MSKKLPIHPDAARRLADHAFSYIASDEAMVVALLDACGASLTALRAMAQDPDFALFLLDFILDNDQRTIDFADSEGIAAEQVMAARAALSGPVEDWL